MSTVSSFRSIENKHDVYKGKDCMKMKLLTKEQQESYENAQICYICVRENLKINI